jgi:exonuclease III
MIFFNSTKNKRGVGILIKQSLPFRIIKQINSEDENLLALHLALRDKEVLLVSIYGPNGPDPAFFDDMSDILNRFANLNVIIGGDWNATFSAEPVNQNIDCLNMVRLPNINHSNRIFEICESFNLTDPYRILYPDRQDFTYIPRYNLRQNKSRIDFFLILESLLEVTKNCYVRPTLQNKLFDHLAVTLLLNGTGKKQVERYAISTKELNDDLLVFLVHSTVAETYLHDWQGDRINGTDKNFLLNSVGTIKTLIRECGPPFDLRIGLEVTPDMIENQERKKIRIHVLCQLLDINFMETGQFVSDPQVRLETLLLNL